MEALAVVVWVGALQRKTIIIKINCGITGIITYTLAAGAGAPPKEKPVDAVVTAAEVVAGFGVLVVVAGVPNVNPIIRNTIQFLNEF